MLFLQTFIMLIPIQLHYKSRGCAIEIQKEST